MLGYIILIVFDRFKNHFSFNFYDDESVKP